MHTTRLPRSSASLTLAHSLRQQLPRLPRTPHSAKWRTRFAPAPTGFLHLGHVVNALHVWGIARAHSGSVLLRIEDHDRLRCRASYETALLDDLDWLGFEPDVGITPEFRAGPHGAVPHGAVPHGAGLHGVGPQGARPHGAEPHWLRQSDNSARYLAALHALEIEGLQYGCTCTRKEIALVAGNSEGEEARYPGTCAALNADKEATPARRLRVASTTEIFDDVRLGRQLQTPAEQCGDFLLRDRNGNYTYQFAVTVDDWQQDIDFVIRGEDLLQSTGRQLQLARVLGRTRAPLFLHHALVLRDDGKKLSKSLGDSGVNEMRSAGLTPQEILGQAAFASGLLTEPVPLTVNEIAELFV